MRSFSARILVAAILGSGAFFLVAARSRAPGDEPGSAANQLAAITIDYPLDGSVFPPEITPPTFLWRDDSESAKRWLIEVSFANRTGGIRVEASGYSPQLNEIDLKAGQGKGLGQLTPREIATRAWRPDAATWAKIKSRSLEPATITITGFADGNSNSPVSRGTVTISTSVDPVGAPVFYRDVPLVVSPRTDKGSIQPLPPSAIPLIKWRLRSIAEPESHVVMEKLSTCANCHSFSADGKTMGLDLDGPKNDKGLYAVVPVQKFMTIRNQDVIRWSSFQENLNAPTSDPAVKRFGFMSQVSPDGRYVVTSIGPPGAGKPP